MTKNLIFKTTGKLTKIIKKTKNNKTSKIQLKLILLN